MRHPIWFCTTCALLVSLLVHVVRSWAYVEQSSKNVALSSENVDRAMTLFGACKEQLGTCRNGQLEAMRVNAAAATAR